MKKIQSIVFLTGCLALSNIVAYAAETKTPAPNSEATSVEIPIDSMTFQGTGYGQNGIIKGKATPNDKEIRFFDGFGKISEGQHGTLLRWPSGFKSIVHAHTYDYFAVVIKGTMLNYRPDQPGPRVRMKPGSYWFQAGKEFHVTECVSKEPCEGFLVQKDGKFDALFK
jgi:hypothetical protein